MPRKASKAVHDPVTAYAKAVAEGSIIAGPQVRDTCKRHLRDLENGHERGLRFDPEKAQRAIDFFPTVLRLTGGEYEGKAFHLLDWQAFIVGSIHGWMNSDGFRRFRMAFVLTGKGSGKSPLAAGLGLYALTADGEPRAEIFSAASKLDQAKICFRDACAMVRQSPALSSRLQFSGGPGREYNIAFLQTGSFFRPISAEDGQSGPRPHAALVDELHEHRDNSVIELLRAGTKGRRQALIFAITNAESDRTGVCAQYRDYAAKVARGDLEDDSFFSYVAALDDDDDPMTDETCWPKANPSLGQTFGPRYLREQVQQARGMPAKEAVVRRLNFCQPTEASENWVDRDLWDACEADFDVAELAGLPVWLGLDLSQKRDLTACAAVWRHPPGGKFDYTLAAFAWTPAETAAERGRFDNVPYSDWIRDEHLFGVSGRIIDYGAVAAWVQKFGADHDIRAIAFDQALIDQFERACDDIGFETYIIGGDGRSTGIPMQRHGQGFAGYASATSLWMPKSVSTFEELIINKRIRILRNPVLRWNSASAVLESDAQGNRRFSKKKATGRIDMIIAATMAIGAATANPVEAQVSIWDRPDLWDDEGN